MELEFNPDEPIFFGDLFGGNTFILMSDIESPKSVIGRYMKLSDLFEFVDEGDKDGCYNAVCFNNGELVEIKDDKEVILLS